MSYESAPLVMADLAESDDRGRYDENDQGLTDSAIRIAVLELSALLDEIFTVL
ncbi:hypothetical protein PQR71_04985 [Paraburkholderia fungorum]|jgi:hypothetical protein|uniref:hypothetical protein n=1 Tax=Paraburkholderia fungorum TaxID=134537 RepID=UPI0038BAB066